MENVDLVQDNFDVLLGEISVLKNLRDDVATRGECRMEKWVQNVKAKEHDVAELRKEFKELYSSGCPSSLTSRLEFNKKVIECLTVVADLKKEGNYSVVAHRVGVFPISKGSSSSYSDHGSSKTIETFIDQMARERPLQFSHWQLKSFTSDFSCRVGFGAYGEVYKGLFPNGVQLAVKVLKDDLREDVKKQFMAEVSTMCRTYHRNLVRLYGFCFDANMKALVYEYMENGSLDRILYDNHLNIEWEKLYDIATDTARGLSYLHENCHKRIIHYDIKAGNVLIDKNLCPKIADFGLAKLCSRDLSHVTLTGFRGTPGYAAPEVWRVPLQVTYKCDVYSYAMLLFEVLGRKRNLNRRLGEGQNWFPLQVWEKFEKGQLEELMTDCGIEERDRDNARKLCMVALWCAQFTPQARPSMSNVVKILEGEMQAMVPPNPFPHMVSSGVTSTVLSGSSETMTSLISSKLSIKKDGDSTLTGGPVPLQLSSLKVSPIFTQRQVELQSSLQLSIVEVQEEKEENKETNPEEKEEEVITVVLMVYMHCEACARKIKKCLMRMKGVQTAAADLHNSQVTVKGVIDAAKLVDYVYKKTNKRATIMKIESERTEKEAIARREIKKKREESAVMETMPESKPNKLVMVGKNDPEKAGKRKAFAKTEEKKKQEEKGDMEIKLEKTDTKLSLEVKTEPETTQEGKANAKTEPKKKRQENRVTKTKSRSHKREEKGVAETKEVKSTADIEVKEEEMKSIAKNQPKRKEREEIEQVQGFVETKVHKKEEQEEHEEETVSEKTDDKGKGDDKEKEEEAKTDEERNKVGEERHKNVVYVEPPKYYYRQGTEIEAETKINEFNEEPPIYSYRPQTYSYPPQIFSDENPHAWCSIQ